MSEPKKPLDAGFDPGDWLVRAEAYGYVLTLAPDYAGRLGLSYQMPLSRPPDAGEPVSAPASEGRQSSCGARP